MRETVVGKIQNFIAAARGRKGALTCTLPLPQAFANSLKRRLCCKRPSLRYAKLMKSGYTTEKSFSIIAGVQSCHNQSTTGTIPSCWGATKKRPTRPSYPTPLARKRWPANGSPRPIANCSMGNGIFTGRQTLAPHLSIFTNQPLLRPAGKAPPFPVTGRFNPVSPRRVLINMTRRSTPISPIPLTLATCLLSRLMTTQPALIARLLPCRRSGLVARFS